MQLREKKYSVSMLKPKWVKLTCENTLVSMVWARPALTLSVWRTKLRIIMRELNLSNQQTTSQPSKPNNQSETH